jgi:hypothetical protein
MSKQWHWEPTVGYFPGMHVADAMADLADKGFVHVDQVAYVIAGHVDPFDEEQLYWSNTDGWVSYPDADVFSKDERMSLNLPIEGRWEEVAEDSERVVRAACQQCAVREQVTVPADRHDKYLQGGLIQEVFPEYSAQQREVLMNALPPWRVDRPFSYFLCTDCWHDMGAE